MPQDICRPRQQDTNAIAHANLETAEALWMKGDFETYIATRDSLVATIRGGSTERLGIDALQFIYFINTLPSQGDAERLESEVFLGAVKRHQQSREAAFDIGDVVQLKSGGTTMTVHANSTEHDPLVGCSWFDEGGNLKHRTFLRSCLCRRDWCGQV
jgi:uncharacterized protein YodC (DUF2158 family)